ncbi:hypothetical protein FB567DRAFT_604662 [Paraphoma chrysanthemicola]|uniref:Protein kinase domain-containing protein n=1 Tax=Paraphoma chrysanthemicola TaxID=798071 RepID=A0A8K0VW56_9PLEO|nr:hypothetical protein FB567DRAFT_604662 [Paraphoma chrysanthemicola]
MRVIRKSLWGRLQETRQFAFNRQQHYFPNHVIDSIFTEENIAAAVAEFIPDKGAQLDIASTIFGKGRKLFAILLWNHKEESITKFIEHRILDSRLPLGEPAVDNVVPDFGKSFASDWQWRFLPFVLDSDLQTHHGIIEPERIFPYLHEESIGEGAFGEVLLTAVDSSQQTFTVSTAAQAAEDGQFIPNLQIVQVKLTSNELPQTVVNIVRKRFKPRGKTNESINRMLVNERNCLRELGRLKHRNIIQMLGSYTHQQECCILFPFVELNLDEFLKRPERFGDFIHDRTFLSALQGLASALSCVHNLKLDTATHGFELERIGYHHDFRPHNILVSPKTFLLADFGLSKIKTVEDGSRTEWKAGAYEYRAPECTDMLFHRQEVGRSIDMWAFGCMIVEVVTYMKKSSAGIEEFRKSKHSPGINPRVENGSFHNGRELKPSVQQWLIEMLGEPFSEHSGYLINISLTLLVIVEKERLKCPELCRELNFCCAKAHVTPIIKALESSISRAEVSAEPTKDVTMMEMWFEKERLKAWAAVFGLAGHSRWLQRPNHTDIGETEVAKLQLVSRKVLGTEKYIATDLSTIGEVRILVQSLWDLLTPQNKNLAQFLWCAGALDTEDIERLHTLELRKPLALNDQYSSISAQAAMKHLRLRFERDLPSTEHHALLAEGDLCVDSRFGSNHIGTYRGSTKVFVEVLRYDKRWEGMEEEERATRMQLVAEGLQQSEEVPELRVPKCIGFVPMEAAFGFLYPFPDATEGPGTLLTLLDAKPKIIPALESRIQLANKLVLCIAGLQSVGWLHRNFSSANILFFTKQGLSSEETIVSPYVVGLTRARPDQDTWHSEGPDDARLVDYCHPEYAISRRFQLAYDYYSLGIVLLEIGLWRSVGSITGKWPTATPEVKRERLMGKYATDLRSQMGSAYYGAVLTCMDGSFVLGEGGNADALRDSFYERVQVVL